MLAAVLAALASWPAAHHLLARTIGLDPWLMLGWSMYAVPDTLVQVNLAEVRGERVTPVDLPADVREKARRFAILRESIGELARPDRLAREVLGRGRADGVVVGVRRLELDRRTARIVARDSVFRYDRDGNPLPSSSVP